MKNNLMNESEDIIRETLKKDLIGRQSGIKTFIELLDNLDSHFTVAIDAKWGEGKTFFIKQVKYVIDAINCKNGTDISYIPFMNKNEMDYLKNLKSCMTIYYDAWVNDSDLDPILSLVWAILKDYPEIVEPNKKKMSEIVGNIADCITGRDVKSIMTSLKGHALLDSIRDKKTLDEQIKIFFETMNAEQSTKVVLFIDELDRCRPSYAVKMLERIKHYICLDSIIVVYSVNIEQLQHTIRKEYGDQFDAIRYLDKFFDMRIPLPMKNESMFYNMVGVNYENNVYAVYIKVIEYYQLSTRERIRYLYQVNVVTHRMVYNNSGNVPIEAVIAFLLAPVLIGMYFYDVESYNDFMDGNICRPYLEILDDKDIADEFGHYLLRRDETYFEELAYSDTKLVKFGDKLNELQSAIIECNRNRKPDIRIGNVDINKYTKIMIINIISGLSEYSDYSVNDIVG